MKVSWRLTTGLLLGTLGLVLLVAVLGVDHVDYRIWSDRDLLRATAPWGEFPVMGAEMNGTYWARVPGGAYYWVLRLLMLSGGEPAAIRAAQFALLLGCLVPVWFQVRALWGLRAALMAVTIPLSAPAVTTLTAQIWNPAISIPMVALATAGLLGLVRGRPWALPLLVFGLIAGLQVHLSNLALSLGCTIAALLFGRDTRRFAWLAAALVAAVLLAPYVAVEAASGWSNTRLILIGQGQPTLSRPHVDQLLRVLAALVGSPESDSGGYGPPALLWGLRGAAALMLACAAVEVGRAVAGLSPLRWRSAAPDGRRAVLALAIVVATVGGLLLLNRNSSIYLRYSTPLTVPVAVLVAAALATVLERLERGRFAWAARVASAILAASWTAAALLGWSQGRAGEWPPRPIQAVLQLAEQERLGAEAVRRRVVVLRGDGQPVQLYMDYLLARQALPVSKEERSCIALLPDGNEAAASHAFATLAAKVAGGPATVDWRRPSPGGWSVGYRLPDGNCWRGVDNPYRPYAAEVAANSACVAMAADGGMAIGAGRAAIRRTFPAFRLCFGVGIEADERGDSVVELSSTQLRGYTGFPSDDFAVDDLRVTLIGADGAVLAAAPVMVGRLGGTGNPTRSPWRVVLPGSPAVASAVRLTGTLARTTGHEGYPIDETVRVAP